jgi:hypothetical protein
VHHVDRIELILRQREEPPPERQHVKSGLRLDPMPRKHERPAVARGTAQAFPLRAVPVRKSSEIDARKTDPRFPEAPRHPKLLVTLS